MSSLETDAHPDGAITVRETPMQAGLRSVRDMADAPEAANDDARVEKIAPTVGKAIEDWCFGKGQEYWAKKIIAADPATARLRALEEENRALRDEVSKVANRIALCAYTSAGDPKLHDDMKMYAIWAGALKKAIGDRP